MKKPEAYTRLGGSHEWAATTDGYTLLVPDLGVYLELSRVRRDRHETIGLLRVKVSFRGARTVMNGLLSSADFNCSSLRARSERAKHLAERGKADEIDWFGLLEELCVRVLEAEELGDEERPLEQVAMSAEDTTEMRPAGLPLLRRHPTIWFSDGGAGKSYLALYAAVNLVQAGERVLYCDWEFSGEDHRRRLHRLVGQTPNLPHLLYRRCDRSFSREISRIKSIVGRQGITFLVCDSLGFAADGTPEGAEAATGYYKALRELPAIGSLHLAHISKAEHGDQKPFGSVFWANGARSTWFLKRTDAEVQGDGMTVGFYHRKSNVGRLQTDFGVRLDFQGTETRIYPTEITDHEELADKLPLWQRMKGALARGPLTAGELAEALDAREDTISRTARRMHLFTTVGANRIGLADNSRTNADNGTRSYKDS